MSTGDLFHLNGVGEITVKFLNHHCHRALGTVQEGGREGEREKGREGGREGESETEIEDRHRERESFLPSSHMYNT